MANAIADKLVKLADEKRTEAHSEPDKDKAVFALGWANGLDQAATIVRLDMALDLIDGQ